MGSSPTQADEIRAPILASWALLMITCLLSVIPLIGFLAWVMGSATILIAIVLAIVVISRGAAWHGIFILLASLIVVPCIIFIGPIVSTIGAGAWLGGKKVSIERSGNLEAPAEAADSAVEAIEILEETPSESATANEGAAAATVGAGDDSGAAGENPPGQ